MNGQARFVHSLPQCSLGRNRFQSKHLLKIVVFTKLLDPVKVWFGKTQKPRHGQQRVRGVYTLWVVVDEDERSINDGFFVPTPPDGFG